VVEAGVDRGAVVADFFGCGDAPLSLGVSFSGRVEEGGGIHAAAGRVRLPLVIGDERLGQPLGVGHFDSFVDVERLVFLLVARWIRSAGWVSRAAWIRGPATWVLLG
jgi:hypothetical protein